MATYDLEGLVFGDDSMEDGYVRFVARRGGCGHFFMTEDTWYTLSMEGLLDNVMDVIEERGEGTHLIPRSVIDPGAAREVTMALDLLEPAESDTCTLPHCWQSATSRERGFPLCAGHAADLQDWDSLVA